MRRWMQMAVVVVLTGGLLAVGCDGGESDQTGDDASVDTGSVDTGPRDTGGSQCADFCAELDDCSIPYPNCETQCRQGAVEQELRSCVEGADNCDAVRSCYGISNDAGGSDGDAADTSTPDDTTDGTGDTADGTGDTGSPDAADTGGN